MTASSASAVLGGSSALWVSGNTYRVNDVARSPADWQLYVRITAGAGTTDPASDGTNWAPHGGRPNKPTQRGKATIGSGSLSTTVTISAVNTAKAQLSNLGFKTTATNVYDAMVNIDLTNSTTITVSRWSTGASVEVSWELKETY